MTTREAFVALEKWLKDNDKTMLNDYRTHLVKDAFVGGWQACDELNKARIATLELENKTLLDLLREARDDVANQLQEYQALLPYKQHRYDAQKITLDEIEKALATPTLTEHLDAYCESRKDNQNLFPDKPTKAMWEAMSETSTYVAFDRFERDYQSLLRVVRERINHD